MLIGLIIAIAICGTLNIVVDVRKQKTAKYISKPLTMLLVIALLFVVGPAWDAQYRWLILAALIFSLAGDVFLMFEDDYFIFGLASFLVAHIVFVVAFASGQQLAASEVVWLLPFLFVGVGMLILLWPHLKKPLRLPVIVYVTAIVSMCWMATLRFLDGRFDKISALLVLVGALLFLVSDAVLSIRRFVKKFAAGQPIILSTYFAAQVCFALSCIRL